MTCSDKCIHFPVCEPKKYDFANIDECQYYEEQRPHGEWKLRSPYEAWFEEYKCSNCNAYGWFNWHFCPNCGSDNRKKEKQNDNKSYDLR